MNRGDNATQNYLSRGREGGATETKRRFSKDFLISQVPKRDFCTKYGGSKLPQSKGKAPFGAFHFLGKVTVLGGDIRYHT